MPNSESDSYYDINLPGRGIMNFTNCSEYIMANDNKTLKMSNKDMQTKIFDPIIKRILNLIDGQLKQAKNQNNKIDAILMVGGFSQSGYLRHRVKEQYNSLYNVIVPFEGVTAISHGAVSYALNPRMISRRSAGQSLSLEVQAPYEKQLTNSRNHIVEDFNGTGEFENDRLEYFVTKNQELDDQQQVYTKDVFVIYPNAAVIGNFFFFL